MALKKSISPKLPVLTLAIACVSLLVHGWPDLQDLLVYDRPAIQAGEVWRLGTACFVHFSWRHLFWDLLVFAAAGWTIQRRAYRGYAAICCLSAVIPGVALFLIAPDLYRYGGLSGLATGAVAYLCLCEQSRDRRHRAMWLGLLVLVGLKIIVETITHDALFAAGDRITFRVLPSVHLIGIAVAVAVYGTTTLCNGRSQPRKNQRHEKRLSINKVFHYPADITR